MSSSERRDVAETDIAIIGMSGRFPGAENVDCFWRMLCEGREGVTRFTRDELAAAGISTSLLADPAYVPAHGVIPDVDLFDTGYFELTPTEAEFTDPQHRILLMAGHAALENAGYDPARFDGLISVYAGAAINTYLQQQVLPHVDQTITSNHFAVMVGNDKDFLATRLAYKLDLKGPAYSIQTACSTSLVAIHLACQGLINGECDMALAGGVTVKLPQTRGYLYEDGAILSRDGYVRAFDADASGTVLGNGVGVVVLKPLRDALADRDTIHAVIKGTATNNDGSAKVSFAAPGVAGQGAVIREAHAVSGIDPRTIGYVEAHATATRLGDPAEVTALTKAFRAATTDTGFCAIGSVKSNVGHLDAAAGVAGVIKTALMLKHRTLVPTINYQTPNPAIDFASSPFRVSTTTEPWVADGPRRAGVSSFGIGGTNAHAVLEEPPAAAVTGDSRARQVLVLSARTGSALRTAANDLAAYLTGEQVAPLADVAYTLAVGRRAHEYRLAVCGADRVELAAALREAAVPTRPATGDVSFVFTERVADATELAARWCADEPVFAEHHAAAVAAGAGEHGDVGQAFALQYALGRLWLAWGLRPAAIRGDGRAARVAACLSGSLSLDEAVAGLDDAGQDVPTDSDQGRRATSGADRESHGLELGVADGPWEAVARAWRAGAKIDWAAWFDGETRGRVPLPTYPFEGRRCWMTGPQASAEAVAPSGPHPMLDENISTLDTLAYRGSRSGTEFYLADHRFDGEPVMPAVGYLELARAAGELSTVGPVGLRDVSFDRLLSFASGPRTAVVSLRRERDRIRFEITDRAQVHAAGEVSVGAGEPSSPLDLPAIGERCAEVVSHQVCYDTLRSHGLDYGPRMRSLARVSLGEREALAELELPEGAALAGAVLNPALLDGALHAVVALLARHYGEDARGFMPVALGELVVHAPLTGPCLAYVSVDQVGDRSARADVAVADARGQVLVRLRELVVRVLRHTDGSALLVRRWVDQPVESGGEPIESCVVIAAGEDRRTRLTGALASAGIRRLSALAPDEEPPTTEVPSVVVVDEPEPAQVLRLVRWLLRSRPTAPVRVLLLHRHAADGPRPERAALGGLARTVRAENPLLALQVLGVDEGADEAVALADELAGPGRDVEVRHAVTGRQVPNPLPAPAAEPVPVRDGGVYVITGGAGGLGRIVADWLCRRAEARVVLLGRGEGPPAETLGGRLVYRRADVSDPEALAERLAEIRTQFGPITGVVHAAGVLRDGFALSMSDEDLAAVLAPKVTGLRALDTATADDPLDFFVAFSSIAAHIGSVGQAAYAYANAFLEAYAARRDRVTAVAWPMWADGGMRQTAEAAADILARTGFGVMPTATGLELLGQALGSAGALIAAYGDIQRITDALAATPPATAVRATRPVTEKSEAPRASALRLLRELIAGETGLDPAELDEDAPLDRYGIDSLMITKLNRELDRRFDGLSKTLFFEYTTLGELADYFATHRQDELGGEPSTEQNPPAEGPVAAPRAEFVHPRGPSSGPGDEAIAVIGIAGRYPMADDLDEFWANLVAGRDCVSEIPADRWDSTRWYDPDPATPGRAHTRWGGFLRDVDRFDPLFFGISPRQAELMDPQERLFLQSAWHALEDAGYRPADVAGHPVGVYVGVMYGEYQFHGAVDVLRGGRPLTGSSFATIANRVSYAFDLSGPSLALDTMCSSSLTAIHLACESLRRGESELAIAGGVNVSIHPYKYAFLSQGRYLSSDGRCRAFGAGGDGYVPGEGVGAVLLKPYRQALADGDRIHGVILASAVNHGARTNGYTVPNPRAQQRVISTAMTRAGVSPEDIGYVEAHGTGTALGDPIELTGLASAYQSAAAEPGRWPIGSVKSNVGHLESAAGMAGLTKVLLQFEHRSLVPSLHSGELNPNIDFDRSPFRVQRELAAWPSEGTPRRAGLSSFGAGGANAHLVLEEAPNPDPSADEPAAEQHTADPVAFLLSARDEERLRVYADEAARFLETQHVPLADLCFTTQVGREGMDARLAVVTTDGAEIARALRRFAEGGPRPEVAGGGALGEQTRRWLAGAQVDWAAWHASRPGTTPRRVRAPLYPFAPERHWIPLDPELGAPPPHPLVDANESTVAESRFRKTLRSGDALLRDHVIDGRPMLAGAVTLEFVRAAASLAEPGIEHALREVVWGRPVELSSGELPLHVSFVPADEGLIFEVHSQADGARVTHVRGNAVAAPGAEPELVDLEALRARLPVVRERTAAYADYLAAGFEYGPSFQVIDEIRSGPAEALVRLSGRASRGSASRDSALLDGALRACHWVGRTAPPGPGDLAIPFSLGSLEAFAPLPDVCYAYARLVGEVAGVRRFALTVCDERGRVVTSLRDFAGRAPDGSAAPGLGQRLGQGQACFYEPCWRAAAEPRLGGAAGTLALLGAGPELTSSLAETGTWRRVVDVDAADNALTALLAGPTDTDGLDLVLVAGFTEPAAFSPTTTGTASLATTLEHSCRVMLQVLQAVESGAVVGRTRCLLAHPWDQGEGRPEWAALAGLASSTATIAPRFELVTLAAPIDIPAAELATTIVTELRAEPRAAGLETRRTAAGVREVRALRRATVTDSAGEPPLRDHGVYVITGGGGAIGRLLAEHLARTCRARLVLISRSQPDTESERWCEALADHGAEVLTLRADVARREELDAALAAARERFGALHGVFHLAGVADSGRATDGDHERFTRVLAAKTHGLVALDQLTRRDTLDLFVVFSSISSLLGDFGAGSYATANRFADLYTSLRESWVRRGERHGRSLSLSWPLWSVGGVDGLVGDQEFAAYSRRSGMRALDAEQGLDAFARSFAFGTPWLVPAWGDQAVIDAALLADGSPTPAPEPAVPAARPATGGRRGRLVDHLRGVLSRVLKLPESRLDSRVPLETYGLDSVLVMESNTVLGKDFPGLRGTVFFECRTVEELADHLLTEHAEAVERLFPEPNAGGERPAAPDAAPALAAPVAAAAEAGPARREPAADEPIAVIGISGRYPHAADLDEFWRNLVAGHDAITEVPADRWDAEAIFDPDPATPGRSYGRWGGFLPDVDAFDSLFFQISPMQARSMDPQERLFLETAWSALENAGYPPSRIPPPRFGGQGHDVGVFVGVMWDDYAVLAATESARGNHQVVLANRSSIANQVSYFGDFRGPSVVVDTACSASLVAVHQACESIRRGECAYAIAGGVNVAAHPDKYVHLSRKTMLSTDGRCRAFGAGGDGYVPGEGVGAVVLKRLSDAVRDGDTVHAVIRASVVNHGGRTSGFTVPNPHAQQALVEQALATAGVDARTIGCVEAHGTGTSLGDPIEHTALARAFATHTSDTGFCALGSVKSAIGHLEGAAGIAGLTKAVLQLRHGTLVPTLHAEELNPVIDFSRSPFVVQRETAPWPRPTAADGTPLPRRAAVSSFGAGGTNAHVIVEEYLAPDPHHTGPEAPELIVLSARDEPRLREYAARLGQALAEWPESVPVSLADIAHTLRVGREAMTERVAFVAGDIAEAAARLTAVGRGEEGQWAHRGQVRQHPPLADLFTEGVGGEDFLTAQIRAGNDDMLARLWVSGVSVDWDLMHRVRPAARRRVPLPTYPFERARHWLAVTAPPTHAPSAESGSGRNGSGHTESGRIWQRTLAADEPMLRDHLVAGRPVLPGVGHLALVAEASGGLIGRAVTDVRWMAPLVATGAMTEASVRFDGERYEVLDAGTAISSTGRLGQAPPAPPAMDVAALRARLHSGPDRADFYRLLEGQGLPYGPFFRRIERVWTGDAEALGRFGPLDAETDAGHPLHPGVLDAALHTIAALMVRRRGERARPMLPFAAERVEVFGAVPLTGWSHVRETGTDRCDVLVLDDDGSVCVRFGGLTYREAKPPTVVGYRPTWTPRPADGDAEPASQVLLVGTRLDAEPAVGIARAHPAARVRHLPIGPRGLTDQDLDRVLGEAVGIDLVYFIGERTEREPGSRSELRAVMDRGVVSLYRLVRALDRHRLLDRPLRLKVVTTDVYPLEAGDESKPWSAGLAGVAMVAAKEFSGLRVAVVDLRSAEAAESAASAVAEPFPARPAPVSLRAGVRRVRSLERVELADGATRFRPGGTYLIIGGLGAVGRDTCRHLARTYRAKLVVVGRSPLDDRRRAIVSDLEAAGAEVRYLALDATDPAALETAVGVAKREFGALHGVINAAMVLVNTVIRELTEARLREALESKTDSTWSVLRAVRDEALDFVLFFSSGVVFEGNHAQAGYAAGCGFADAAALHAARTLPFPVRVLNLGYWHAGGDEDREQVLRRFEAVGIRPMTAERGMAVVERALGSELPQLLALDADQRILDNLGVAAERTLTVLPGGPPPTLPEVRLGSSSDPTLTAHQRAVAEAEELAGRLLAAALHRLGLFVLPDQWHDRAEVANRLGVVSEHAALFQAQLGMLVAAGYLRADGERVRPAGRAVEPEAQTGRAVDELAARCPDIAPVVALLRDCLAALPDVLTGRRGAMEVLFPDGSFDRVAAMYRGDPVTDHCNAEVARLVVQQVKARLAASPGTRVRVLEVGAGTGGTSAAVLAALEPHARSVDYLFTDVSAAFVRRARTRFADHSFVRFEVLDIESDLGGQGLTPGDFDVVLATNVLHATRRLDDTIEQAKRLLRNGGVLLLTEGTRALRQMALIFGLTAGWWLFTDAQQRMPDSPLASERQWRDVLAECGFRSISAGTPETSAGPAFQTVIAAVSDGLVSAKAPIGPSTRSVPKDTGSSPASPATVPAGHGDALAQVTAVFARVLEMAPEQLDPDLTFENYGVDSLVVLELTRGLEAVYGPLPATLLFERITIRALAAHLGSEAPPAAEPTAETTPSSDLESLVADMSDADVEELLAELLSQGGESEGGGR